MNRNDLKMNRNEYIQQRAAIDEAAREIALDKYPRRQIIG